VNDFDEVVGASGSSARQRAVLWTTTGSIRDLGTLPGDSKSEATAINNAGDVVGYSIGSPRYARLHIDRGPRDATDRCYCRYYIKPGVGH
jgi:hypothetical protein